MLSALVVGSLAPDFRYFLNLAPRGHFGHSFNGIFIFCLPVGLSVLWVFQKLMKLPLISLAPRSHQQRLVALAKPFPWGGTRRFSLIVASLLLGSISHLAWDAFTQNNKVRVVREITDLDGDKWWMDYYGAADGTGGQYKAAWGTGKYEGMTLQGEYHLDNNWGSPAKDVAFIGCNLNQGTYKLR